MHWNVTLKGKGSLPIFQNCFLLHIQSSLKVYNWKICARRQIGTFGEWVPILFPQWDFSCQNNSTKSYRLFVLQFKKFKEIHSNPFFSKNTRNHSVVVVFPIKEYSSISYCQVHVEWISKYKVKSWDVLFLSWNVPSHFS